MARLSNLIGSLLQIEREDNDRRIVTVELGGTILDKFKIAGVREQGKKVILIVRLKEE